MGNLRRIMNYHYAYRIFWFLKWFVYLAIAVFIICAATILAIGVAGGIGWMLENIQSIPIPAIPIGG